MAFKVSYFTFKGLGESIRLLLAYGNVEWIDNRVEYEDWPKLKSSLPLHQLPILEHDGKVFNHSKPICRYLGNIFNLAGSNALENYEIDNVVETVDELRSKIKSWYFDIKVKDIRYEKLINEEIPFYLGKLESQAKGNGGFLALNKISWADVYSVGILEWCSILLKRDIVENYPNLKKVYENVSKAEGVKKYLSKRPEDRIPKF